MTADVRDRRARFRDESLNLLSQFIGMPIGFHEDTEDKEEIAVTPEIWNKFEEFCRLVRADPERAARCDQNHLERARMAKTRCCTVCHAGMVNFCVPLRRHTGTLIKVLGGEMQISEWRSQSDQAFHDFVQRWKIPADEADRMHEALLRAKEMNMDRLEQEIMPQVEQVGQWYVDFLDLLDDLQFSQESLSHEFGIHLSPVTKLVARIGSGADSSTHADRIKRREYVRNLENQVFILHDAVARHDPSYYDRISRLKKTRIGSVIGRAVQVYRQQAEARDIQFRIRIEADNAELEIFLEPLEMAVRNLVQNAVKYSWAGKPDEKREILVAGEPAPNGYQIEIKNFGVGIDVDELEHVFEPGFKGRRTKKEFVSGSGKGLYLAKHVIEALHHGKLEISSRRISSSNANPKKELFETTTTVWLPYFQPMDSVSEDSFHGETDHLD